MAKYVELEEYGKELAESFQINKKDLKLKISTYSKEGVEPHFCIDLNGESCRFSLKNGKPLDVLEGELLDNLKTIEKFYKDKKRWLKEIYNDNLPAKAPVEARI